MIKEIELEIRSGRDLLLHTGRGDNVTLTMDEKERAQCRAALLGALDLLDQTIVKWSTFSMATETDEPLPQSSQRLDGCLAVFDCSPPSGRPAGNALPRLRIVSNRPK